MNFPYMTRMVKATLATAYVINYTLPPITITSIRDVGDGHSLQINWLPVDPATIDHYQLFYTTVPPSQPESLTVSKDSVYYVVDGLSEGQKYSFYIIAYDAAGYSSLAVNQVTATPYSLPRPPEDQTALPLRGAIRISWTAANTELDFDHYAIFRDDVLLPAIIHDSVYIDDDPSLGTGLHQYRVRAVDTGGNMSDTTGIAPVMMKAAQLEAGRILAVNRSNKAPTALVDEMKTGEFLHDALHGLNFDYYSDTAFSSTSSIDLLDMIDYGLLVFGGESGRADNFGTNPLLGGILDHIGYYLSLGGKVIIFGRWGDIYTTGKAADTVYYTPGLSDFGYTEYFDIAYRILPLSYLYSDGGLLYLASDFVGAHSRAAGYPDLVWDSLATMEHTGATFAGVSGIPCPSFPILAGAAIDTLYTYDSSTDSVFTEGQIVGWRSLGGPYEYVFFEFPLTFMNHDAAVAALRQAVTDMGIPAAADDQADQSPLPNTFALGQNYPNPFNPTTTIEFQNPQPRPVRVTVDIYNILGQQVRRVFDGLAQPGVNKVTWDGRDNNGSESASGVYLYRMKTDQVTLARKMILLK
jgi:hypothetical protein